MKIAIVGAGITGSTVLRKLVTSDLTSALSIDVFEPRAELVTGLPYSEDVNEAIMNEHALDLSIIPHKANDFLDWLEEKYSQWADPDAFVPRPIYGKYLKDRLIAYYESSNVQTIRQKIIDLKLEQDKYVLQREDKEWTQAYDAVFFTVGHPPYNDPYHLNGLKNYIHNPYPISEKLKDIQPNQKIGIIGSGLTGLDLLNYLFNQPHIKSPIQLFVPEEPFNTVKFIRYLGKLIISFNEKWLEDKQDESGRIPLELIVNQFKSDLTINQINFPQLVKQYGTGSIDEIEQAINRQDVDLIKLRLYIVKLTHYLPDLYNALCPTDRDYYHQHYEKTFNHFRSQMPATSLTKIIDQIEKGNLQIISGIKQVDYSEETFQITMQNQSSEEVDIMINATGFNLNLSQAAQFDTLLKNLYNQEIFVPHYRKGISVTWPHCQIVTANQGALPRAFFLGHWISGIHYGNNNIHLCIKQAERVSDYLLEQLTSEATGH